MVSLRLCQRRDRSFLAPIVIMRQITLRALRLGLLILLLATCSASKTSGAATDGNAPSPTSSASSASAAPPACTIELPPGACAVLTTGSAPMNFTVRSTSSDQQQQGQKACGQESIE